MKQGESGTKAYIYDNSGAWHKSYHKKISVLKVPGAFWTLF